MVKIFTILVLLSSFTANSQTAELALSMNFFGLDDGVVTGEKKSFEITVTNNGPDAANTTGDDFFFVGSTAIGSNDQWIPDIIFELDAMNSPPECVFTVFFGDPLPDQNPTYGFVFIFLQLEANQSITCKGFYTANFTQGERYVRWELHNNLANDPDLSNNNLEFIFGLRPIAVPVFSKFTLILLVALFLLITLTKRNKIKD